MRSKGASIHTYFYLVDIPEGSYGLMFNLTPELEYGARKVSPKPDFPMIRQVNDVTVHAEPLGRLVSLGGNTPS
jgi:hypothetical protein